MKFKKKGQLTGLFIYLVTFWILILILSAFFDVEASKSGSQITGQKSMDLTTLLKIMTFQYSDQIPVYLTLFLDSIGIFTLYIGYVLIRSGG